MDPGALDHATVARLLGRHRIRRLNAESMLGVLRQPAITVAAGVTEAAVLHLRSLLARLRLVNTEFHQAEQKLDEFCARLSQDATAAADGPCDAAILHSMPGIGMAVLATLLTEAGDPLGRRDYAALRTLSGVAPVTKRSGKTCSVVMRYAVQTRLRQPVRVTLLWSRLARHCRPAARGRLRPVAAAGPVQPRSCKSAAA